MRPLSPFCLLPPPPSQLPFHSPAEQGWATERATEFTAVLAECAAGGVAPPITQISASAAVLSGVAGQGCTAVCVGHALFGLDPMPEVGGGTAVTLPALGAVRAKLIHVAEQPAAQKSSSGHQPTGLYAGPARSGR